VAAFKSARNDVNWLAAEERPGDLPALIDRGERPPVIGARPRIQRAGWYRHTAHTVTGTIARDAVQIRAAHSMHLPVIVTTARVRSSAPVGLRNYLTTVLAPATLPPDVT